MSLFGRRLLPLACRRMPLRPARHALVGGSAAFCGAWLAKHGSQILFRSAHAEEKPAAASTDKDVPKDLPLGCHRKIIFAFDTTDASQFAFDWALKNFFKKDDLVLLLNVRQMPGINADDESDVSDIALSPAKLQEIERLDRVHYELSEARGHKFEDCLRAKKIQCKSVHTMGNPAPKIVEISGEQDADCIVLGTHDRGALGRLTIGGVPTYVVHNARCPVVVARRKTQGPIKHEYPGTPVHAVDSWNEKQRQRVRPSQIYVAP